MSAKNTSPSSGDSSVCGFVNKLFITMAATISDSRKEQPNELTGTSGLSSLIITQAQREFYSLLIHQFVLKLLTVANRHPPPKQLIEVAYSLCPQATGRDKISGLYGRHRFDHAERE